MKILIKTVDCAGIQKDKKIVLPNYLFYWKPLIRRLLKEFELDIEEKSLVQIITLIKTYIDTYKRGLLLSLDVSSFQDQDNALVHIEIYL